MCTEFHWIGSNQKWKCFFLIFYAVLASYNSKYGIEVRHHKEIQSKTSYGLLSDFDGGAGVWVCY